MARKTKKATDKEGQAIDDRTDLTAAEIVKKVIDDLMKLYDDESIFDGARIELSNAIYFAIDDLEAAHKKLAQPNGPTAEPISVLVSNAPKSAVKGPTRVQGQYLAYINEFIMRNRDGIAPSHAELQWFFQTTPPSVNSMLKKLDELGYIEREPGVARSIKITIDPALIPPLDQPFRHG